ncbi:unnamed protein product [Fraxinus pennsylvanica]|uniref:Uncharacterized protein n=1 Tax=Fraxinus pennsylvanica TaxID=56036 RepID=A0AAD2DHZ1_9LAMI|nr:unnamed protein product [Fraxinus pennsylvanica]
MHLYKYKTLIPAAPPIGEPNNDDPIQEAQEEERPRERRLRLVRKALQAPAGAKMLEECTTTVSSSTSSIPYIRINEKRHDCKLLNPRFGTLEKRMPQAPQKRFLANSFNLAFAYLSLL